MTTRTIARRVSVAVLALGLGMAGDAAFAQGYAGSAASTASVLGVTASPPNVPLQGTAVRHHRSESRTQR